MSENNLKGIKIGNQIWMTENLNVSSFRNGNVIIQARTIEEWVDFGREKKPAWCENSWDPWNKHNEDNTQNSGKFYNWHAVINPNELAPIGWHIPSDKEWEELSNYLGGEKLAGNKLRNTSGWERVVNGTNESGFSALPCGVCNENGGISSIGFCSYWWSITESNYKPPYSDYIVDNPWVRQIYFNHPNLYKICSETKSSGLSVRCIKD